MITIRVMTIEDYDGVYNVRLNTPGMGINSTDDSKEGIGKISQAQSREQLCGRGWRQNHRLDTGRT